MEAIAAVEGIDMLAYGHSDLSAALGIHLQLDHPRFKEVVRTIADTCRKHGKLARGSAETEAHIAEYWQMGCQVLNLPGTDTSTYFEGLKARAVARPRDSTRWAYRCRSAGTAEPCAAVVGLREPLPAAHAGHGDH